MTSSPPYLGGPFDGGTNPDGSIGQICIRSPAGSGRYVRTLDEDGRDTYQWEPDPDTITCIGCGVTAPKPATGQFASLWDAGWRWRGDPDERPLRFAPRHIVYSCPACPPVI